MAAGPRPVTTSATAETGTVVPRDLSRAKKLYQLACKHAGTETCPDADRLR